jgi:hypothetical protein
MTRSDEPLFEPRIADWLEDDPYTAPDQALDIVLAAFPSIKQRRAWRVPWRVPGMTTPLRLGLTAAAVGALAIGSLLVVNRGPSGPAGPGGPTPSATPAAAASPSSSPLASTALLDTSTWTPYTSSRYGFSIAHPADWNESPGDHDWTVATDIEAWKSTATDSFDTAGAADNLGVRVSAWSVAVPPGTTVESWMDAYCTGQNAGPCTGYVDGAVDVETGDQHPGRLVYGPNSDTIAFILDGQTMYVVALWRNQNDPSVMPYGGARRLLEAFCSTLTLPTEPPPGSPSAS